MNLLTLYLLLLKATLTSFSGGTSLPSVRQDLVIERRVLTDAQLSAAIAISRMGPGPNGSYVISIGHYLAGPPGAATGYLAMVTPSFLAILFLRLLERRVTSPRWRGAIQGLTAAAAGLLLANGIPIAQQALTSWFAWLLAAAAFAAFLSRRVETVWILAASSLAAVSGLAAGVKMV